MANGSAEMPENIYSVEIKYDAKKPEWFRALLGEFVVEQSELAGYSRKLQLMTTFYLEITADETLPQELQTLTGS